LIHKIRHHAINKILYVRGIRGRHWDHERLCLSMSFYVVTYFTLRASESHHVGVLEAEST
jgi:hypothetical protein